MITYVLFKGFHTVILRQNILVEIYHSFTTSGNDTMEHLLLHNINSYVVNQTACLLTM